MSKKVFAANSQAIDHFTIAKSDTVNFVADTTNNPAGYEACSGIYVGTGGDVVVVSLAGVAKTYKNVANGSFLPLNALRVNSTNTTASDMLGLVSKV